MSIAHFETSFAIWHDGRYGYKVLKKQRKQSGLSPWWLVCTTLKMATTPIRKYHISAPVSTILSCNTTLLYVCLCEDSISDVFSLFRGHLHGQNLCPMSFIAKA